MRTTSLHGSRSVPSAVCAACACVLCVVVPAAAGVRINGAGTTYATIQAAVNAAVNGDALHISTGRYVENVQVYNKNIALKGGFSAADYTTFLPYTSTIIDGSGGANSAVRITNGVVFMNYLKITGGSNNSGAGLNSRYATTTAEYCIIYGNAAGGASGGGAFVSVGPLVMRYCTITNNTAQNGGGVAASLGGALVLQNCEVHRNRAVSQGGGLYLLPGSAATLELPNTDFRLNYAMTGGGAAVNGANLTLRASAGFFHNAAQTHGGGIHAKDGSTIYLDNATIGYEDWGMNWASNGCGGGMYAESSTVTLTNTAQVRCNHAGQDGGGVYLSNTTLRLSGGSSIGFYNAAATNIARRNGGGIYARNALLYLRTAYLQNNHAYGSGGGIYAVNSSIEARDTIIGRDYGGEPRGNRAVVDGAGVFLDSSTASFTSVRMEHNIADDDGGGIYLTGTSGLHATNSVFVRNEAGTGAGHRGGALCALGGSPSVVLDTCQVLTNSAGDEGGGIYWSVSGPLTLRRGTLVQRNRAGDHGGGIYAGAGVVLCHDSNLRANAADFDGDGVGSGGALYLTGNAYGTIASHTRDVLVRDNSALNGGACCVTNGATLTVTSLGRVVFHGNVADDNGGALYAGGAGSTIRLYDVQVGGPLPLFGGNRTLNDSGGGGGIAVLSGAHLEANNTEVYGNYSAGRGGGVYVRSATATLASSRTIPDGTRPAGHLMLNTATNSTSGHGGGLYGIDAGVGLWRMCVFSNQAYRGGGVHSDGRSETWIVNTIVAGNRALNAGAGVRMVNSSNYLWHSTVAHNTPDGMSVGVALVYASARNTIVWGHSSTQAPSSLLVSYCNVQGGYAGTGNIDANPLFVNPAQYNYDVSVGSPCIDTGVFASVDVDCIGTPRPQGDGYDIGAYEFVPEPAGMLLLAALALAVKVTRAGTVRSDQSHRPDNTLTPHFP